MLFCIITESRSQIVLIVLHTISYQGISLKMQGYANFGMSKDTFLSCFFFESIFFNALPIFLAAVRRVETFSNF